MQATIENFLYCYIVRKDVELQVNIVKNKINNMGQQKYRRKSLHYILSKGNFSK